MPKSSSPIRIQEQLMRSASLAAAQENRSTTEQVEYWASIGRVLSKYVNSDTLTQVISGTVSIKTEPVAVPSIDPDELFETLEQKRQHGELNTLPNPGFRYQASSQHPGMLERIDENGHIEVGQFHNGEFTPAQL